MGVFLFGGGGLGHSHGGSDGIYSRDPLVSPKGGHLAY